MDKTDFDRADDAWKVAIAFFDAVTREQPVERIRILGLVTPESAPLWGDFSEVRELFEGRTVTTLPEYPAPDVAYVKVVREELAEQGPIENRLIMGYIITVVRHSSGRWLVHQVGDYGLPEDMPRYT